MPLAIVTKNTVYVRHAQEGGSDVGCLLVENVLLGPARDHTEGQVIDLTVGLVEIIIALGGDYFRGHLVVRLVRCQRIVNPLVEGIAAFRLDAYRNGVGCILVEIAEVHGPAVNPGRGCQQLIHIHNAF